MVKMVYNTFKKYPYIKLCLKNIYQFSNVIFGNNKSDISAIQSIAKNYFFGFHDKCPWDSKNQKILAHKAPDNDNARTNGIPIEIGYFENDNLTKFCTISKTKAWNWQQGAMLQWHPSTDSVYFNDISKNGIPQLIKIDLNDLKRDIIGPATASISPDGKFSASISFFRFGKGLPGYGYFGITEDEGSIGIPQKNGALKIFNLKDNHTNPYFEISLIKCIESKYQKSMKNAYHYISHPQFSPDSKKLAFFHRWFHKGKRVETHLFFLDLTTLKLKIADTGSMFSHFCWLDNDQIFGFYEDSSGVDGYGIISYNGNEIKLKSRLLDVDGHPNSHWQTGKIIIDTYPDKSRHQKLILIEGNLQQPKTKIIGSFYAPFKFQEIFRADLHPRWNRTGNKVAIDCSFPGCRSFAIINIE